MLINIKLSSIKWEKFVHRVFLCSILLIAILCHFKIPDYYANRALAESALTLNPAITQVAFDNIYRNPGYYFKNSLFHICTISFEIMLISFLYKVNCVKKIIRIKWLRSTLRYLYLNIAYPIWAKYTMVIVENELTKYIYVSIADSIMIPIIGAYALFYFFAFLYYPIVNIFNFIVFNTRITNKFLILIYKILLAIMLINVVINMTAQFNYAVVIIHLLEILYVLLIVKSIDFLQKKYKNLQMYKCGKL